MKHAFTLLELLIVIAIIAILAAFLWPVTGHGHGNAPRSSCQSNLKQIGLGLLQYTQDYNALLPPATMGTSSGWADAVQPYIKSWQLFQCPSAADRTQPPPSSDYFFNTRLSRAYTLKLDSPALTIMSGDGEDQASTWVNMRQLPPRWILDETSPAWRHIGTANYLFADGHVKALKPIKITNASPKTGAPTFAVR